MVKLNDRKIDGRINLLKLSNRFILVPEGDLTQRRLFFLHRKRFVRNQSHRVTRKSTCGLSFGSQQSGVSVIYGNMSWLTIITAQAQVVTSILFFLRYWSSANHIGHIHRTEMSFGSGARGERNNRYSDSSGRLSRGWVVWLERGFSNGKIGCIGLDAELRLLANFLHVGVHVAKQ